MYSKRDYKLAEILKRKLKENPNFSLDPPSAAPARVFIGAEGDRVPDKLLHEIWYAISSTLPRKRGSGRVSAAKSWRLATRFRAWPPLVRSSGRFLLESAS